MKALYNILLFTLGIILFALNIHGKGINKMIGICALGLPAYALYRHALKIGSIKEFFVEKFRSNNMLKALMAALLIGIVAGVGHRYQATGSLFPSHLTFFACMAALIGITEEIIFRGFVFFLIKPKHLWIRVIAAAFLHAGYKALLFIPDSARHSIEIWPLFIYTFQAGLVLGALRLWAGHIAPPVAAHAAWDVVVYGDSALAPWWVWY